jgi:hypothetical protein
VVIFEYHLKLPPTFFANNSNIVVYTINYEVLSKHVYFEKIIVYLMSENNKHKFG